MTDQIEYPEGWEPQLGMLPDTGAPRMMLGAGVIAAAVNKVIPTASDHMSIVPWPTGANAMLGNNVWGNCVVVAIVNAFLAQWRLFRPNDPLPRFTAQTCIDAYKTIGGYTTPPGNGLDIQSTLNWFRKNGIKDADGIVHRLLCFMAGPPDRDSIHLGIWEFGAVICGANMYASQLYSRVVKTLVWDPANQGAYAGGHAFLAGAFPHTKVRSWALTIDATDAFIAQDFDRAVWYPIFEDLWPHYGYDRQVQCVTDLQAITGKAWSGPAPVSPVKGIDVLSTQELLLDDAIRLVDSRIGLGVPVQLKAGVSYGVQVAGAVVTDPAKGTSQTIPANAVGISVNVVAVAPLKGAWMFIGPKPVTLPWASSSLNYPPTDIRTGYPVVKLDATGKCWITCESDCHVVVDVTSIKLP